MNKDDDNPSPPQEKLVRKHRSRFVRFLRGVGWTALGLVALVLIFAVLGMIIPPPRDPKAAALDNEDFGLGFKVGDRWDVAAMEAALKACGLDVTRMQDPEPSAVTGAEKEEYPFHSEFWQTRDGRLCINAFSSSKMPSAIVRHVDISSFIRSDWSREKAKAFYQSVEKEYPDNEARDLYISTLGATEVAKLYPQLVTAKGLGIGSRIDDFYSVYGRPDVLWFPSFPTMQFAFYFRDQDCIVLYLDNGIITAVSIMGYPLPRIFTRLGCWYELLQTRVSVRSENESMGNHDGSK